MFEVGTENQPPTAGFTYSPKNPMAYQNIVFDASNSEDLDGTITNYKWNFGDETTGFGKVTTHSYAESGTYDVTLIVTDDDGATDSTSKEIMVGADIEEITIGKLLERLYENPDSVVDKRFTTSGWVLVSSHEGHKGVKILWNILRMLILIGTATKGDIGEVPPHLLVLDFMGIFSNSIEDQNYCDTYKGLPYIEAYATSEELWAKSHDVVNMKGVVKKVNVLGGTIYRFEVEEMDINSEYANIEELENLNEGDHVKLMAVVGERLEISIMSPLGLSAIYYIQPKQPINILGKALVKVEGTIEDIKVIEERGKQRYEYYLKADSVEKILSFKKTPTMVAKTQTIFIHCPVNATITDQYGRIISDDGINEMPGADMFVTEDTKIFYLPADLTYSTEIDAYDTGTFNFTRVSPIGNDISITRFENIPVTSNTKASVEIEPGVTDYTMSIDYDGDGVTDEEKSPDVSEMIEVTTPTNIIYVPDDYPTIQQAVNTANSGDMIIVRDGIYNENIDVNKPLTIRSENGAENCIVQAANSNDHVFEVTADYMNISGFAVEGATEWVAGIYLRNVDHCSIINNYVSNSCYGIELWHSSSNIVSNNNVNLNEHEGITLYHSSNNNIENNNASNNGRGIDICTSCNDNIITNNDVNSNNNEGIVLSYSCDNNTLTNNNANSNKMEGIDLYGSSNNIIENNNASYNWRGINIGRSSNNIITNNNACNNDWGILISGSSNNIISNNNANLNEYDGIHFAWSPSNTIKNNNANLNNQYGIYLWDSSNNNIYRNNLISNIYNVHLHNSTNIWISPSKITYTYNGNTYTNYLGNYWDDYKERYPDAEEVDSTGIWDTAYSIDSDKDNYPLTEPWEEYFAVSQPNLKITITSDKEEYSPGDTVNITSRFEFEVHATPEEPVIITNPITVTFIAPDGSVVLQEDLGSTVHITLWGGKYSIGYSFKLSEDAPEGYYDVTVSFSGGKYVKTTESLFYVKAGGAEKQRPTAFIDSITPNPATQGKDTIRFKGHGEDADGYIVEYLWASSINGRIISESGGSEEFEIPASALSVGTHTIGFKVKDNEGQWSEFDTATLTIKPGGNEIARVVVNAPGLVRVGGSFEATIDVDSVTNFNSGLFDLSFDPSVVKVTNVVDGCIAGETIPVDRWDFVGENRIRVLVDMPGIKGVSGSGYLAKVIFKAGGKGGEKSVLDISNGMLVNTEAGEIPAEWIDDEIRILA